MYHDIANDLIHSIENKLFKEKLPTEHQLMERYNVSRNTIRKAIDIVAQKGLVRRVQGSGYFINDISQAEKTVVNLTMGSSRSRYHKDMSSKIVTFDEIHADAALAKQFGVRDGAALLRIIRLRYTDKQLYSLEYAYYVKSEVPSLTLNSINHSIFNYIKKKYNIRINNSDQYLSQDKLSNEAANLLGMQPGTACMTLQQSNYYNNDVLFNFSQTIYVFPNLSFYFHAANQSGN
ncbi:GntR family transcriptional regulator [Pediococcus siamensis]|uniref:GntR family transcriptional regulator n=1 Tax=Pediococcus siamensis TaxID=381829 RepID=UPI0039A31C62